MQYQIPDQLPQLAVGSHERGSGMACIMNAISYLNGDLEITDMPDCTYQTLSVVAMNLNDSLCMHRDSCGPICPSCSNKIWLFGARIIGTAEAVAGWSDYQKHVLNTRLAIWCARQVLGIIPTSTEVRTGCEIMIRSAEAWCDGEPLGVVPVLVTSYTNQAIYHASLAAKAAFLTATATDLPYSAGGVANAYTNALVAKSSDRTPDQLAVIRLEMANGFVDEFERLTGTRSVGFSADAYETVTREAALVR